MASHRTHITLPGSAKATYTLKACSRCKTDMPPEGGVSLTPTKGCCFGCWRSLQQGSRKCTA